MTRIFVKLYQIQLTFKRRIKCQFSFILQSQRGNLVRILRVARRRGGGGVGDLLAAGRGRSVGPVRFAGVRGNAGGPGARLLRRTPLPGRY